MPEIPNMLNIDMQSRINSYRELAGKAVRTDDSSDGAVAALERFFHKLEFLLKEGCLPRMDDVKGKRLPAELQGLKDFLDNPSLKTDEPHYLQRNETERYSFSWGDASKLIVTQEVFHASLAGARSGYACAGGWRAQETTENVEADLVLQALKGNQETEKTSLSGPAQTQPVTDLSEPVVIDDTASSASSAGRVDTAPPQADQNEAEQTAPAEQPEVTGTESQKTNEPPVEKTLEEQREELKREIEEKEANLETARREFVFPYALWDKLEKTEGSVHKLEETLQFFTDANSEGKQEIATSFQKEREQIYWTCKNKYDLINANDLGDLLSQLLSEDKRKCVNILLAKCIAYKFGLELKDILNVKENEEKIREYSNNTKIIVTNQDKGNGYCIHIYIENSEINDCIMLSGDNEKLIHKITTDVSRDKDIQKVTEHEQNLQTRLRNLEPEITAFKKEPKEAYLIYYNNKLSLKREQLEEITQQLSVAESRDQEIKQIRTQLDDLYEKLEKVNQNIEEAAAPAEQQEVTGTEAAAPAEQQEVTGTELEKLMENTSDAQSVYCAIEEKLYFTKEVKAIWSARLSAQTKLFSANICLDGLTLTSKQRKELYELALQESLSEVKQALSLINTENASDYLYSAFAVNSPGHIHESMEKYLSRKIGSELGPVLSNRDKEVEFKYSNGTCITLNKKHENCSSLVGLVVKEGTKMFKQGFGPRNRGWSYVVDPLGIDKFHIKYVSISVQKPGEEEVNWLIHRDALSWWQTNDEKESHANKDADKEKLKADLQEQMGDLVERLESIDSWDEQSEQKCLKFYKQRKSIAEKAICDNQQRLETLQTRLRAKDEDETLLKQELTTILKLDTNLNTELELEQELIINNLEEQLRRQEKILEQQGVSVSDLREHPVNSY